MDISQTASWPPATICKPRLWAEYTYRNRKIHVGAVTRHQHRASQTQAPDISQTASHLLTTATSHNHVLSTCIRKNFKIRGDSTLAGVHPSSSHKESVHPGLLTGRVSMLTRGGTEVHRFFWGSWGSEVPRVTLTLHPPNKLNPLLNSLTPLVTCPKVGTFGMRPMDE